MAFAQWASEQAGLAFLGVHVTDGDEAGREFAREYGWEFPVLSDNDWSQIRQWGINSHPATILIDEFGRVAHGFFGPADAATWDNMVARLG